MPLPPNRQGLQQSSRECSRYADFTRRGHVQRPYRTQRQYDECNVGADIDDTGDPKQCVEVDAVTRRFSLPNLLSRCAFEYLDECDCDIEENAEVEEQLYADVGFALAAGRKDPRVEQ